MTPEIEQKMKDIADKGLLHDETIMEIDLNRAVLSDPKLMKLLEKYDTDGDGEFSIEEISHIFNDMIRKKKQMNIMKKVIAFAVLLILVLLVSNTFLTLWMLKLTKVVDTSNGNNYLTNTKGDLVVTDKPRYYVTIADLPSLPPAALNAFTRLSFTTVDSSLRNYDVEGIRFSANNSMTVYFTSSKQLIVSGDQMVFSEVLDNGVVNEVNVEADNQQSVNQRRLQLVQGLSEESSRDLTHRCSLVSGVCYHTFDEMMVLSGRKSPALMDAEVDVSGNRRLQTASTSTTSYAVIAANVVTSPTA